MSRDFMKDIKVYNQEGKEIGKLELNEAIFNYLGMPIWFIRP